LKKRERREEGAASFAVASHKMPREEKKKKETKRKGEEILRIVERKVRRENRKRTGGTFLFPIPTLDRGRRGGGEG